MPLNNSFVVIEAGGIVVRTPEELCSGQYGLKAAGLAGIPRRWVPPFFVVASGAAPLGGAVAEAMREAGIPAGSQLYVRSSGVGEGLSQRGRLVSEITDQASTPDLLRDLNKKLAGRYEEPIHFVVQQAVRTRAKGHLSNERRVSAIARDWIAEFEPAPGYPSHSAPVAVRKWRNASVSLDAIECALRASIPRSLRTPAQWAGVRRAHFEWVWDGQQIWLVQYDEATQPAGINPRALVASTKTKPLNIGQLAHFRAVSIDDLAPYRKLANAQLYRQLGYGMPTYYLLDDPELLSALQNGDPAPPSLVEDLEKLTAAPLVLRTDGARLPEGKAQMLPRSDELRSADAALGWLRGKFAPKSAGLGAAEVGLALIGHHFIPAAASAWCLAYPDRRRVRVEALWGIPEGLYYFPHDVFDIDTGAMRLEDVTADGARVVDRSIRFKGQFVAPDRQGNWVIHATSAGSDWASSISRDEWLKEIAVTSRRIAASANRPTVVMWFIEIPKSRSSHDVLPWYHEEWREVQSNLFRTAPRRAGTTPHVRTLRNARDLAALIEDTRNGIVISAVAVEPAEEEIVREPSFIDDLAKNAKEFGYEVQLRGGVLSHVFYALAREGALVSCIDLFEPSDETAEFNKLVRDKIPTDISARGEKVELVKLEGEALLVSLKRKLIEEAIEVADANDTDSISGEVADVLEVLDALLETLQLSKKDVAARQRTKREKRGGFQDGLMLVRTRLPSSDDGATGMEEGRRTIDRVDQLPRIPATINVDRRTNAQGVSERLVKIDVPMATPEVFTSGHALELSTPEGVQHPMRIEASVNRETSELRFRLRIFNDPLQLSLFSDASESVGPDRS